MRRVRIIPVLLLADGELVKTVKFGERKYIGDPINTVKILNDKEVDEIVILDIDASRKGTSPDINKIADLASECFMPLAYGGGITDLSQVKDILNAGVEKVIFNTSFFNTPDLIRKTAEIYGSQSVVVSLDVKRRRIFGGYNVLTNSGRTKQSLTVTAAALKAVESGAGEILLNSIECDGMMSGYDLSLIKTITEVVPVPVVACGGAGSLEDFVLAINEGKASAVAAGSLFVFKGPHKAVLVNYPDQNSLSDKVYRYL